MILSTHGIVSSISGIDADWLAYYNRVIAAGGSLTTTEQSATLQLVLDLKANSLWTPMKAIYPMVGASAAACAQNLKSSSFTGTFTSGWTFASTGVTGNGTSAYMNTTLNPSSTLSQNNASLGYYGGNNLGQQQDKPAISAVQSSVQFNIYPAYTGLGMYGGVNDTNDVPTANSNTSGFIFASRIASTTKQHFIRNVKTNITRTSNGIPNTNVVIAASNNSGSISEYSAFQYRFVFIGDGLTDTQAGNFYTAVQAFQTTLSRNV